MRELGEPRNPFFSAQRPDNRELVEEIVRKTRYPVHAGECGAFANARVYVFVVNVRHEFVNGQSEFSRDVTQEEARRDVLRVLEGEFEE